MTPDQAYTLNAVEYVYGGNRSWTCWNIIENVAASDEAAAVVREEIQDCIADGHEHMAAIFRQLYEDGMRRRDDWKIECGVCGDTSPPEGRCCLREYCPGSTPPEWLDWYLRHIPGSRWVVERLPRWVRWCLSRRND